MKWLAVGQLSHNFLENPIDPTRPIWYNPFYLSARWVLFSRAKQGGSGHGAKDSPPRVKYEKEVPNIMRVRVTLRCNECKQRNYNTVKNKKNTPDRLEMNKYCRFCRKHTLHTETK